LSDGGEHEFRGNEEPHEAFCSVGDSAVSSNAAQSGIRHYYPPAATICDVRGCKLSRCLPGALDSGLYL
jgi:hypothetical protein